MVRSTKCAPASSSAASTHAHNNETNVPANCFEKSGRLEMQTEKPNAKLDERKNMPVVTRPREDAVEPDDGVPAVHPARQWCVQAGVKG